jgi:large subunit ribosomal protein L13
LRGKNKPEYTPHVDTGDNLIIINSDKIKLTGNKPQKKVYSHHTHHPGGLKTESFAHAMQIHPERVLEHAIKGMLPHNSLGNSQFKKLHVYAGAEHKHLAQKPKELTL